MIVAQGLSRRTPIPAAVWNIPIGCYDVEGVIDEVVLKDAVIGCAGCQRGRGVDLRITPRKPHLHLKGGGLHHAQMDLLLQQMGSA